MAIKKQTETNTTNMAPLPCGVVLFDDPQDPKSASTYLPNTPNARINSVNALRNDAIWISNLPHAKVSEKAHPNLRSNFYFKLGLDEIAHDLGMRCSSTGQMSDEDAQKLSVILTRTMTIAARAYGWDSSDLGPLRVQGPFLDTDIAKSLPSAPSLDSRYKQELTYALTQANQRASVPSWDDVSYDWQNSIYVTLRYNRVSYFGQLLSHPLPAGKSWSRFEGETLEDESILEKCITSPSLVKATIEWNQVPNEIVSLTAVGRLGYSRNFMRHWFSQPELVWLSQYADVAISCLWLDTSEPEALSAGVQLPALFHEHPESTLSHSAGLVALSHYNALCSGRWSAKNRIEEANIWSTWLRALDRAHMFRAAVRAYNAGFRVNRYGSGSLQLKVKRDQIEDLLEFKKEQGFMYPDIEALTSNVNMETLKI